MTGIIAAALNSAAHFGERRLFCWLSEFHNKAHYVIDHFFGSFDHTGICPFFGDLGYQSHFSRGALFILYIFLTILFFKAVYFFAGFYEKYRHILHTAYILRRHFFAIAAYLIEKMKKEFAPFSFIIGSKHRKNFFFKKSVSFIYHEINEFAYRVKIPIKRRSRHICFFHYIGNGDVHIIFF